MNRSSFPFPRMAKFGFRRSRGFSLVEIAIVLVILTILITIVAAPASVVLKQRRAAETQAKLPMIETALALFVAQNYRLPCPALGTVDATDTVLSVNAGTERVDSKTTPTVCTITNQQHGVLPWKELGLTLSDVLDGWGNVFTYRVDATTIRTQAMNLTSCTPGGTGAAAGSSPNLRCDPACSTPNFPALCTAPATLTAGRGLKVQDVAGNPLADPAAIPSSTGAAYVVISHGENTMGAYTQAGTLNSGGSPAMGTQEAMNSANLAYSAGSYLVDNVANYNEGTSHFDDVVLRRSILSVATKAQLGPRSY